MIKFIPVLLIILICIFSTSISAQEIGDGTYDATVTTSSGTYSVPVEVESGVVSHVEWPNGGNMSVDGAELDGTEAYGYNSRGDFISIEIDE